MIQRSLILTLLLCPGFAFGFKIIAHRGLSGLAPESTEVAYVLAAESGADALEGDLQLTQDGEIVVFHDKELTRTTNAQERFPGRARYYVQDFTLAELKTLDTGSWFNQKFPQLAQPEFEREPIITLDEFLNITEAYDKSIYLEIKSPEEATGITEILLQNLRARGWIDHNGTGLRTSEVVIQAFSLETLAEVQRQAPQLSRLFLVDPLKLQQEDGELVRAVAHRISPFGVVLFLDWLNPARWLGFTQGYHRYLRTSEHQLEPWTINSAIGFHFMDQILNAPALYTDRTDLAYSYLKNRFKRNGPPGDGNSSTATLAHQCADFLLSQSGPIRP